MKIAKKIAFLISIIAFMSIALSHRSGASNQDNGLIGWIHEVRNSDDQHYAFDADLAVSSQDNGLIGWIYENQNSDSQGDAVTSNFNDSVNDSLNGSTNDNLSGGSTNDSLNGSTNDSLNYGMNDNLNGSTNDSLNGSLNDSLNGSLNDSLNGSLDEENSVDSDNADFWLELDAMLQGVDLRPFDSTMRQAPDEVQELWGGRSAGEIIKEMASGNELVSMEEAGSMILNLFKRAFFEHIGFITALLALSIITGFLEQIKGAFGTNASDMAGFVCYSMAVILAAASFARLIASTRESLDILSGLMEMAFPPLLILLGASGAPASAGLLQPATTLLTATMNALNKNFFLPLFLAMGVLSIVENISKNVSLGRMQKLLQSVSKWSIGGISTLYLGVITLRGINAKAQDGLSLRAARYALDKFVPYVGTLLSGSTDAALGAALILKNGLGICVLMALCGLLALPLLRIITTQLAFRVISAAVEAMGDSRLAKATDSMANALSYLFAIVAVQALMFILTVALIMGAGIR